MEEVAVTAVREEEPLDVINGDDIFKADFGGQVTVPEHYHIS